MIYIISQKVWLLAKTFVIRSHYLGNQGRTLRGRKYSTILYRRQHFNFALVFTLHNSLRIEITDKSILCNNCFRRTHVKIYVVLLSSHKKIAVSETLSVDDNSETAFPFSKITFLYFL